MVKIENIQHASDSLWEKCERCSEFEFMQTLVRNSYLCQHCGHYYDMPALSRLKQIFQNKFEKITLPLENDILICSGEGTIFGSQVVLIAISRIGELQIEHLDSFLITIQYAIAVQMPLIVISSGMNHSKSKISLSYIAQITIEMNFHKQMNLLQISVLTDGNMTDSLSTLFPLGDLTLVEWEAEDNRPTTPSDAFVDHYVRRHEVPVLIGQLLSWSSDNK